MNKEDFLRELAAELADLPEKDRDDAIKYYSDYIDDAGYDPDTVIEELGSPQAVAANVRGEASILPEPGPVDNPPGTVLNPAPVAEPARRRRFPAWAIVVLTILSPLIAALGLAAVIVGLVLLCLMIFIALFLPCATLASVVGGILMLAAGADVIGLYVPTGFFTVGGGFAMLGFGSLLLILTLLYLCRFLPFCFRSVFFAGFRKKATQKGDTLHE